MANRSATFYIEGNNAILEIRKKNAKPMPIREMAGLIWRRIRELNTTPLFGRVASKRNIADMPPRRVAVKYKSIKRGNSEWPSI